jgi:hypothetical protein
MYVPYVGVTSLHLSRTLEQINARDKANQHPLSGNPFYFLWLEINFGPPQRKTAIVPLQLVPSGL